jgi:hypothetical protein
MRLKGLSIFLFFYLSLIFVNSTFAETYIHRTNEVVVLYKGPNGDIAQEVTNAYPAVRTELIETFRWEVDFRPEVVLVNNTDNFRKMVGNNITVAFAVPDENRIVLDTSRVYTKPFTLKTTLKHELCHILLHRNIEGERLPRWLDEGVCQWASGGISELMTGDNSRALAKAAIFNRLISIKELNRFPVDERLVILAYEESKSIVEYISSEFGGQGMLNVLEYLHEGHSIDDSIQESLSVSTSELEMKWRAYLKRKYTWFSYFSNNLYTILFFLAAIITVCGFIRLLKKKGAYKDEEEGENEEMQ